MEGALATIEQVLKAANQPSNGNPGDVMDGNREKEMFPDSAEDQQARARAIRALAARGMAMAKALGMMRGRGNSPGGEQRQVRALRGVHRTPWQVALQRWLEGVSPGERTYMRASRRGADRDDVVMPGRQRYSMMLNVILDTSASMADDIPGALGAIADFCEATGVDEIRLVQCDTAVTSDELLSTSELANTRSRATAAATFPPR